MLAWSPSYIHVRIDSMPDKIDLYKVIGMTKKEEKKWNIHREWNIDHSYCIFYSYMYIIYNLNDHVLTGCDICKSPVRLGECQKCRVRANHPSLACLASMIFVAKKLFKLRNTHCVLNSIFPRKPLNINWLFLFYKVNLKLYSELSNKLVLKGNIGIRTYTNMASS